MINSVRRRARMEISNLAIGIRDLILSVYIDKYSNEFYEYKTNIDISSYRTYFGRKLKLDLDVRRSALHTFVTEYLVAVNIHRRASGSLDLDPANLYRRAFRDLDGDTIIFMEIDPSSKTSIKKIVEFREGVTTQTIFLPEHVDVPVLL